MPRFIITIFIFFSAFKAVSQLPQLNWARAFEENNTSNPSVVNVGTTVGVDEQGNVYSAGQFEYSVDFDPGPGVYSMQGAGPFNKGIFILKLDRDGNFIWAKQLPTYVEFGRIELKVDRTGNVYLASDMNNPADMDPGPGVLMLTPAGFRAAFVLKFDTNGNLVWGKQFSGPGDTGPQAYMIELDANNNVIIGGLFNNTVDFDPGPNTFNITSSAHMQAYLVKLDNNGGLIWAKQFGNGPEVYSGCAINDMKCDKQNNIVITGSFQRTCDFDPGPGTYNVTSSPGSVGDGFICKLDADCNFIWVKTFGQNGTNNHFMTPTGIDIDRQNNIVTTGFFIGNFDFDPGPATQVVYRNPHEAYVLKLDQQGNLVWVKIIGGSESDAGYDVAVDSLDNVYMIGPFGTSVDFDPGPGEYIINSPYYGASVLVKLAPGGGFVYAAPFQSISYGTSNFRRMFIDPNLNIYVAGTTYGVNDFDPGPNVYPFSSGSYGAPFVLKLSRCLNVTTSTLDISACDSYTLNNQVYDASGTYQQTIPNVAGCDSLITLNLAINKKLTAQSKTICEGETFFAGGASQAMAGIYFDTMQTVLGCDSVIKTTLVVNPRPAPDLGADKPICRNAGLTISPGVYDSYLWQDNSTGSAMTVNGAGQYWVRVTNGFGCAATDTLRVTAVLEPPADFLEKADSICSYETKELIPSGTYSEYHWSTGATGKVLEIRAPGEYRLQVTDGNGCVGSDTIAVFGKECMLGVYIPTAFTPDGNGRNDLFRPVIFGNLLKYRLSVYNRWGNLVFETTDSRQGWDGRVAGRLQDNAVFVWICTYQLEGSLPKTERGTATLIR